MLYSLKVNLTNELIIILININTVQVHHQTEWKYYPLLLQITSGVTGKNESLRGEGGAVQYPVRKWRDVGRE